MIFMTFAPERDVGDHSAKSLCFINDEVLKERDLGSAKHHVTW